MNVLTPNFFRCGNFGLNFFRVSFFLLAASNLGCVTTIQNGPQKVNKQEALITHVKLGMTYLQKNNRDGALRAFSRAIAIDKRSAEGHQGIALVQQLNGERDMAEASFKRAIAGRFDISKASVQVSYGRFLTQEGRCKEALPYFQKASNDINYPSRANSIYLIGMCALEMDDESRAKASFDHALNLNPNHAKAAIELAAIHFEDRDYANAKKFLDMHSSSSNQSPRSLLLGIKIERIFGNKDKEASYSLALKNLHPYSAEYLEFKQLLAQ